MPVYLAGSFQQEFALEKRSTEATRIRTKYPDRIPIILEQSVDANPHHFPRDKDMKRKFLVPGELTVGQFIYVIRKRLTLSPEVGLFIYMNGDTMVPTSQLMAEVDAQHQNTEDHFLYITYTGENTFGGW